MINNEGAIAFAENKAIKSVNLNHNYIDADGLNKLKAIT